LRVGGQERPERDWEAKRLGDWETETQRLIVILRFCAPGAKERTRSDMITATIGLIAITATLTGKRTHGHISRAALGGFGSSPRVFGRHGAFSRAASIVLSKKWEWL